MGINGLEQYDLYQTEQKLKKMNQNNKANKRMFANKDFVVI